MSVSESTCIALFDSTVHLSCSLSDSHVLGAPCGDDEKEGAGGGGGGDAVGDCGKRGCGEVNVLNNGTLQLNSR